MRLSPRTFAGAVVVLTGAASGLGEQLAYALAAEGAGHLVLVDRDADRLDGVTTTLAGSSPATRVTAHVVDLADREALAALAAGLAADLDKVDLLVNNAGVALHGRFDQLALSDFDWLTDINLRAPVVLTHALLPALRAADPGAHVVNLSSLFGLIAPPGQTAYATSKFGLRGFSEALRAELLPVGIGVTTVHPGGLATRIATSARAAVVLDPELVARQKRAANRMLRLPPARAAQEVLAAARRRRTYVVVGRDARLLSLLPRLAPARAAALLARADRATAGA